MNNRTARKDKNEDDESSSYSLSSSYSDSYESDLDRDDKVVEDNDEDTADLDDVELLKSCSREDLFMLIKEDPKYYLDLIKSNKLENELSILIKRSDDGGGLYIKFRIYPEDRWTEVGYWDSGSDDEIYADFQEQIKLLLSQSRSGRQSSKYTHLGSQLDANNNVLSNDYGKDIKLIVDGKNGGKGGFTIGTSTIGTSNVPAKAGVASAIKGTGGGSQKLNAHNLDELNRMNAIRDKMDNSTHLINFTTNNDDYTGTTRRESVVVPDASPVDIFVKELISKITKKVPTLFKSNDHNYTNLIRGISDIGLINNNIPDEFSGVHNKLLQKIKGCQYIQRIHGMTDWENFPELYDYLVDFHQGAMKLNPTLYHFSSSELSSVIDDDDREVLKSYVLDISQIWLEHLHK